MEGAGCSVGEDPGPGGPASGIWRDIVWPGPGMTWACPGGGGQAPGWVEVAGGRAAVCKQAAVGGSGRGCRAQNRGGLARVGGTLGSLKL